MAGRDRADRLDALAEQCQLDDFFLVDGKMEGLAHALVVEGRAVVVQDRAVPRGGGYAVDPELGAGGPGVPPREPAGPLRTRFGRRLRGQLYTPLRCEVRVPPH